MSDLELVEKYVMTVTCSHCGGSGRCNCNHCDRDHENSVSARMIADSGGSLSIDQRIFPERVGEKQVKRMAEARAPSGTRKARQDPLFGVCPSFLSSRLIKIG